MKFIAVLAAAFLLSGCGLDATSTKWVRPCYHHGKVTKFYPATAFAHATVLCADGTIHAVFLADGSEPGIPFGTAIEADDSK